MPLRALLSIALLLNMGSLPRNALAQQGSDREHPIPMGQTAAMGDYMIHIDDVDLDATQTVLELNGLSESPIPENRFVVATLNLSYTGAQVGDVDDLQFSVVGPANVGYVEEETLDCGGSPADQNLSGDIFPGGTVQQVRCWSVPADEANSLVMYGQIADSHHAPVFFGLDTGSAADSPASDDIPIRESEPLPSTIAGAAEINLEAQDPFVWSVNEITAVPGQVIEVTNGGFLEHNFTVDELSIAEDLPNGEPVQVTIPDDAEPGDYAFTLRARAS